MSIADILVYVDPSPASSDLLIMGAYEHSRMREMILGGVTRHILPTAMPRTPPLPQPRNWINRAW